jgi:Mrp family chromosome partitioning ATPase/capsular polysaccharide biosynthesis protein
MTEPALAAGAVAPASAQPLPPSGAFMPLVSLRERKWLALAIMLAVAMIGAPLAWFKKQPGYVVYAAIYVAPRFAKVLKSDQELEFQSNTQYLQYVEQQVRNISRYDIVLESLRQLGAYRAIWQPQGISEHRAALRLMQALSARAIKNTYLIAVTLEGDQAEGLAETLNVFLRVYLEIVKKEDLYGSDERLANLRTRQADLARAAGEKTQRRAELAEQLGVAAFDEGAQNNPYERLLQESGIALNAARRKLAETQAALDAYDPAKGQASKTALDAAVAQIATNDSGLNSLKYHLWARRGDLLNEISGLSPKHPLRAVAERKLKDLDEDVRVYAVTLTENTRTQLLEQRRTAVREARQIEQALVADQQRVQERAKWFIGNYNEGLVLTQDIKQIRSQLDAVNERIDFLTLETEAPGFLRVQSAALPPEYPIGGSRKMGVLMALVAAMALGLIVPIGLDVLDRRIKTATQVHRLLGFAPVAALLDKQDAGNRLVWLDQMRRLVLAMGQEERQHGARRIALTAVKAGSGVTELLLDLAQEFARDGLRVIVVEANALKPDNRYLSESLAPGLIDLLNGEVALDQVIVPAQGALPDRIPVGLALQRHLPFYDRFPQTLDPLLESYDVILLDAPPVLLSADTEFLARYADVMLLLVSAQHTLPGELERAARLLEKADPRVFGVIVNRLKVYKGGGYYADTVKKYQESETAANGLLQAHLDRGRAAIEPSTISEDAVNASRWRWFKRKPAKSAKSSSVG